mmetsp:Transcript_21207/g.47274  ORF Transcript_21207/g.47274 Transcript_21207/m.47274 type:complete len:293 (-) Transcript_21207:325-1203(-)
MGAQEDARCRLVHWHPDAADGDLGRELVDRRRLQHLPGHAAGPGLERLHLHHGRLPRQGARRLRHRHQRDRRLHVHRHHDAGRRGHHGRGRSEDGLLLRRAGPRRGGHHLRPGCPEGVQARRGEGGGRGHGPLRGRRAGGDHLEPRLAQRQDLDRLCPPLRLHLQLLRERVPDGDLLRRPHDQLHQRLRLGPLREVDEERLRRRRGDDVGGHGQDDRGQHHAVLRPAEGRAAVDLRLRRRPLRPEVAGRRGPLDLHPGHDRPGADRRDQRQPRGRLLPRRAPPRRRHRHHVQ